MCYPKPGPRCSASAAAKVSNARRKVLYHFHNRKNEDAINFGSYEELKDALHEAEEEYKITPAGIKELERKAKNGYGEMELERALRNRQERLALLKDHQKVEEQHAPAELADYSYSSHELSNDGDVLYPLDEFDPDADIMMAEAEDWAKKLTPEEIETLQWYSREGYDDINGTLSSKDFSPTLSREELSESTALLDSAISKASSDKEVVVYRRHFFYDKNGDFASLTLEEKQALLPKGSIYKPAFFMSTSLDPNNAPFESTEDKKDFVALFQIKAKKAASLSVVANSGSHEKEFLLPRDTEYRVVDNSKKVTIDDKGNRRTVVAFQLEEV